MTQEEKQLLLQDLCARLPYGIKAILSEYHIDEFLYNGTYCDKVINLGICGSTINLLNHIEKYGVRPYLRSLSSMTEEEFEKLKEYSELKYEQLDLASYQNGAYKCLDFYLSEVPSYVVILVFDCLNAHHFDYRGLIEKGLALEAPKDMYK